MPKKIRYLLILILVQITSYIFTAMYSFHQLHKGIYFNDKELIEKYVDWQSVRGNVKNFINVEILKQKQSQEIFEQLGDVGILLSGFAGKFVEIAIDTYLNSDGVSLLLEKSKKKDEIPKPSILTLLGSFIIMDNNGLNSFYINYENEGKQYPIYFKRYGFKWKIINIEFPKNLFDKIR
jgi:hypothetical protein|tara:strand:+ start:452 stop:988 length:537 start_codon:yes stop_codon:yes gene_type:complete